MQAENVEKAAYIRFDEVGLHRKLNRTRHIAGPIQGTSDWQYVECVFETLDDSDLGWIDFIIEGGGIVWFDDVALQKV